MGDKKTRGIMSIKNIFCLFLATNIVALGVCLVLTAGFGTDPLTVLQDGFHAKSYITIGQASLAYNSLVILMALLFARKRLGLGTIVYSLSVGFFMDCYMDVLKIIPVHGILCLVLGLPIMCLGSSFIMDLNLGQNGLNALLLTIQDRVGIRYAVSRTAIDALETFGGWLMGGTVGVGTLVCMLVSGFLTDCFASILPMGKIIRREN